MNQIIFLGLLVFVYLQDTLATPTSPKFTKLNIPNRGKSGNLQRYTYLISSEKANFFQAFINCLQAGTDLVSTTTIDEDRDLEYALSNQAKEGDRFWLSGTNLPDTTVEQFYWLTGGNRVVYTNWLQGEPDNEAGNEYCLGWESRSDGNGWNDLPCEAEYNYICQTAD